MIARYAAAALLALEAAGVTALLVWQGVAIATGDTVSLSSALALAVLTAVGVALLVAFSVATSRGRSWGRSGGIVVQALVLAVAIGALTGEGADPVRAAAIAAPALLTAAVLVLAARADARTDRADGANGE